jgi:hypothetical protein
MCQALPLGTMLGDYRLDAVIGHGGFGITYRAFDSQLTKVVAIKEYLPVEFAVRGRPAWWCARQPLRRGLSPGAATAFSTRRGRSPASAIRTSCRCAALPRSQRHRPTPSWSSRTVRSVAETAARAGPRLAVADVRRLTDAPAERSGAVHARVPASRHQAFEHHHPRDDGGADPDRLSARPGWRSAAARAPSPRC